VCRSKHVEPSKNFGIINSVIKLHLVGISTESSQFILVSDVFPSSPQFVFDCFLIPNNTCYW
jgi:hypothetical protein